MPKWLKIGAIVAGALIVVGAIAGLAVISAQAREAQTSPSRALRAESGPGPGMGRGGCGEAGLEAAAKVLGTTPDELSTQLWGGRTLAELADKAGVKLQDVRDSVETACEAAAKQAIEEAVSSGRLTREQADWMLKGYDLGFMGGPSGGPGGGFGRHGPGPGW